MAPPSGSFLRGWVVQGRTIKALLLRDLMMRYGRDNLGFLWVFLEPMILTVGVMAIWSILNPNKHGIKVIELVLTGYMPLTLWRHLTNNTVNLFRGSAPLLYHRQVTLLDLLAARQGLEFIATTTALLLVWGILNVAGITSDIQRLDLVILGWLMMGWIGIAFGAAVAAVTEVSETAERMIQPIQYLNIPLSGVFFMVDWLPEWGQKAVMYHPLVHCYEVFRAGYFGESVVTHYDLTYFSACAFGMTFIGLLAVRAVRSRVQLN